MLHCLSVLRIRREEEMKMKSVNFTVVVAVVSICVKSVGIKIRLWDGGYKHRFLASGTLGSNNHSATRYVG